MQVSYQDFNLFICQKEQEENLFICQRIRKKNAKYECKKSLQI